MTVARLMIDAWYEIHVGFIPRKIHRTYIQAGGH